MKIFFMISIIIILLFSFSLSAYLNFYTFKITNKLMKQISFVFSGLAISFIVGIVYVVAIWP